MNDTLALTAKSYGAFEMKEFIKKSTVKAFIITMGILLLLLIAYLITKAVSGKIFRNVAPITKMRLENIAPPPDANLPPPPPPPPVVNTGPITRAGTPVPVPDAEITPDMQDFASIKDIDRASAEGGSGLDNGGFSSNIEVNQPIDVNKEEEPSPDDFIAVEKDPEPNYALLKKNTVFPEMARRAGIEGKVIVRVLVGKDGKPKPGKYKIEDSSNEMFNQAAIDAIMKTPFTPAIQNGQPIEVWVTVPMNFQLR
ncbi:MAG: TonB family protein [Ignavibacteria bacterium]|nr:TonB family protein [Ignavibacteria bacterium]